MMKKTCELCPVRQWVGLVAVAAGLAFAASGCESGVKVADMGGSVTAGGMKMTVSDYQIRRLEVVEGEQTYKYPKPVLAIPVEFENVGKDPFRYSPTHEAQQMTEATTPLLYSDPGKGKSLPPKDKTPINGVVLEEGTLEEQVDQSKEIKPGKSIKDVMLFEVPGDKKADLIFSIPPRMHRGSKPVLFRIPYKYQEPSGEQTYGLGDIAKIEGVEFKVKSVETQYIELDNTGQGKGFSKDPLVKISYQIKNGADSAVTYEPGHRSVSGQRSPILKSGDNQFARVRFSGNVSVVGQISDSREIKPGKKVEDFSVFERPGKSVKALTFVYPASRFGRGGLLEFNLPYEYKKPDKPEALSEEKEDE